MKAVTPIDFNLDQLVSKAARINKKATKPAETPLSTDEKLQLIELGLKHLPKNVTANPTQFYVWLKTTAQFLK